MNYIYNESTLFFPSTLCVLQDILTRISPVGFRIPVWDMSQTHSHVYILLWILQFKYADCLDGFLMFLGTFCALCHGAALPCMIIVFGEMIDTFVESGKLTIWLNSLNSTYLSSQGLSVESIVKDPKILRWAETVLLCNS